MRGNGAFTFSSLLVSRSSDLQLLLPPLEHAADDRDDQRLGQVHDVVELGVGDLGLDHPELGQVAARLRLLGAERRAEAVDPAERHRVRLVVELPALREVRGFVVEVLDREERRRALARRRREDRRVGEDEAAPVEEVADGVDHFVPDAEDRLLARRPDPQVPAVHQVVDAVLLRRDGVVLRFGHDLERLTSSSKPPGARASARTAPVMTIGALLRQVVGASERFVAHRRLRHDALDEAGAVAHGEEVDLAARAAVVQPAAERHRLSGVAGDVFDVDVHA